MRHSAGTPSADLAPMPPTTDGREYAEELVRKQTARWKQILDVQAPYRSHLRRLHLGRTLDVGCGIGRNLFALDPGSLGVDHNWTEVGIARARGLDACHSAELAAVAGARPPFDSLLLAHVIEHMTRSEAVRLLRDHLPWIRAGGRVVVITPQERGFRSDATHVTFFDHASVRAIARALGLEVLRQSSFPFPRCFGRVFKYNEFVTILRRPSDGAR